MSKLVNKNIWIEASAGSGKTKSLIDRILFLILQNTRPSEILCITFTNAAASEMQLRLYNISQELLSAQAEKITDFLKQLKIEDPTEEMVLKCRNLYNLLLSEPVRIQTIHSFCFSIIKRFPSISGIYHTDEIIDDNKAKSILDLATNEVIKNKNTDPLLDNAIKFLGNNIDYTIIQNLLLTQRNSKSEYLRIINAGLKSLAEKCASFFDVGQEEVLNSDLYDKFDICTNFLIGHQNLFQEFFAELKNTQNHKYDKLISTLQSCLPLSRNSIQNLLDALLTQKETPRKTLISKKDGELSEKLFSIYQNISDHIVEALEHSKKLFAAKLSFGATLFCANVIAKYEKIKQDQNLIEYNDILFKAQEILSSSNTQWAKFKIEENINHVLIDEAQDTNRQQWEIIKLITEDFFTGESYKLNKSLFVVGDIKQSIYSFQGADVSHFLEVKKYFEQKANEANIENEFITQNQSYRSTNLILKFIDHVFLTKGLTYDLTQGTARITHRATRRDRSSEIEVWPVEEMEPGSGLHAWEAPIKVRPNRDPAAKLAIKISKIIAMKISQKLYIPSKQRNVQPGDFLILFQRRNEFMFQVMRALKREGIPVAGIDKMPFMQHIAAQDILALCRFVLFPYDNLNLAALLKSPLFGIFDEDLLPLCQETSFENTIFDKIQQTDHKFKRTLEKWIKISQTKGVYDFLCYVLENEGHRRNIVSRMGHECHEIIDSIIACAYDFEKTAETPDLYHFLYWIQEKDPKLESSQSKENEVRIMTVHGAKGLQAPCVVLADSTFCNMKIDTSTWHNIMLFWPSITSAPAKLLKIRKEEVAKRASEYNRLLYVALTRAQDALYIAGSKHEKAVKEESWYGMLLRTIKKSNYSNTFSEIFDGYVYKLGSLEKVHNPQLIIENQPSKRPASQIFAKPNITQRSDLRAVENEQTIKNNIIYKYLTKFSLSNPTGLDLIINEYMASSQVLLTADAIEDIRSRVDKIMRSKDLEWLFSEGSFSDVTFIWKSQNNTLGEFKIDRIVIKNDVIRVIHIKTNDNDANMSEKIAKLPHIYQPYLKQAYPDKEIESYVLWANIPKLERVETAPNS